MNINITKLWFVTTSNNRGSIDVQTEELYDQKAANAVCAEANRAAWHGRSDWIALPLSEGLQQALDDRTSAALYSD